MSGDDDSAPMRSIVTSATTIAGTLLAAAALRFAIVEPAGIAHLCSAPEAPWWCGVREALVGALGLGVPGVAAIAAGVAANLKRSSGWALAAACLGGAGLVLYSVVAGAVGFLLGALVLARTVAARQAENARG